jgi:hypothetical protein
MQPHAFSCFMDGFQLVVGHEEETTLGPEVLAAANAACKMKTEKIAGSRAS